MNSPYNGKFRVSQEFKGSAHDGLDLVGVDSKEIHSTVDGVVEKAGWENASNHSQGFGQYVRICKLNTKDRYYFGHLSQINVKVGQSVSIGDVIGVEGSTGKSTGPHCHYCVRENSSKDKIKDVCAISGIPNKLGTYDDGYRTSTAQPQPAKKTSEQIADEVIKGLWGNGDERKQRLASAGYDYAVIQPIVNARLSGTAAPSKKSNEQVANEVLKGLWGNGSERKQRLTNAGYNYSVIQALVDKMCK